MKMALFMTKLTRVRRKLPAVLVVCFCLLPASACSTPAFQKELVFTSRAFNSGVRDVEFARDGRSFFAAGVEGLKQWDTATRQQIAELPVVLRHYNGKHTKGASSIKCSPVRDEIYVCNGSTDIVVWNYSRNVLVATIPNSGFWISTLTVSHDGQLLAFVENQIGNDLGRKSANRIHIWDLNDKKEVCSLPDHTEAFTSIGFSSADNYIVARAASGVLIYDVESGGTVGTFGIFSEQDFQTQPVREIENTKFANEDAHILSAGTLYDAKTFKVEKSFALEVHAASFVPGRNWVLLGVNAKSLLFDCKSGKICGEYVQFPITHQSVDCCAISPDGKYALTGGWGSTRNWGDIGKPMDNDRNLCLWRLPD